jgi:DNA-binding MurR/RpiR family transcriptional regulator
MIENEVYKRIVVQYDAMSKSHKKIATYVLGNMNSVPFLTVSKLAKHVGVGEATVIRFAVSIGYTGYPDLQRHLQQAMQRKLTSAEAFTQTSQGNEDSQNIIREILIDDIQNLKTTLNQVNNDVFDTVVHDIIKAKRIYILAYRSAASIGLFLEFYLDLILQNTELIRQADGVSEHLIDISEKDLVIGIGFSRYTKRTVEVMKYMKKKGVKTVVITDHILSPLVPFADQTLFAAAEINSFIDSFSAPLSIINALITAVTRSEHHKVEKRLKELEGLWDSFNVFYD